MPMSCSSRAGPRRSAFDAKVKDIVKRHIMEGQGPLRETFTQPIARSTPVLKSGERKANGRIDNDSQVIPDHRGVHPAHRLYQFHEPQHQLRSERRAKEVGIRKVVGALKSSLITQFIGESIILSAFSFLLALGIVELTLNPFDQFIGATLQLDLGNVYFWLFALSFVVFTGVIAGSYPAFYLSSFRPVTVLERSISEGQCLGNAPQSPRRAAILLIRHRPDHLHHYCRAPDPICPEPGDGLSER